MDKNEKRALLLIKKEIVSLCLSRLAYLDIQDISIVADKIGATKEELYAFLYENGALNSEQLNKLAKICGITLSDIIKLTEPKISTKEEKTIKKQNPGLTKEQESDIISILKSLNDNKLIKKK